MVLDSPAFKAAFAALREDAIIQLENLEMDGSEATTLQALEHVRRIQALKSLLGVFTNALRSKDLAARMTESGEINRGKGRMRLPR